jgi:phosphate:Na+ symporter
MAIVMVLGANVGSALIVQLLALHLTNYAYVLFGLGVVVALCTYRSMFLRRYGRALFAFGLIMYGLAVIGQASQPLSTDPVTRTTLLALVSAPPVMVIIGALLAMLLKSSVASIGIVLILADQGVLQPAGEPPIVALVLMLGVNIGTSVTLMIASLRQKTLAGHRLALVHSGTKLLGATVLLTLIDPLVALLQESWVHDPGIQVALTHMGFNLALAIIFVPLSNPLARLMERFLSDERDQTGEVSYVCNLDPKALTSPAVAQGLAIREALHMADIVTDMFRLSIKAFEERPNMIQADMKTMEDQLDKLDAAIKGYLILLNEKEMSEEQLRKDITLFTIVGDLEAIGDLITHLLMDLARRRSRDQIQFSVEGWEGLRSYYLQIEKGLQEVLTALADRNPLLVTKFMERKRELQQLKSELHAYHIRELRDNVANSRTSSAVYVDLLDALTIVLAHISNIADALQEASSPRFSGSFRSQYTGQFKGMKTGQLYSASPAGFGRETSSLSSTTSSFTNSFQSVRTEQSVQMEVTNTQQLLRAVSLVGLGKETCSLSSTASSFQSVGTEQSVQMEVTNTQQASSPPQVDPANHE